VYLFIGGAPNITEYVPPETFIDKKKEFDSYFDLYNYIKNMPEETYKKYLDAIEKFITSNKIYPFSTEFFADLIVNEIQSGRHKKNWIYYIESISKLFKL